METVIAFAIIGVFFGVALWAIWYSEEEAK